MTSRAHILTARSSQGLKRSRSIARRHSRKEAPGFYPRPRENLMRRVTRVAREGISAPDWMMTFLWIFPILGATGWLLIRISDWMIALGLTGAMAAPMATALCFKTAEMKRLIVKTLPLLLFLCGLTFGQSFLVTSILESMRETGIIVPGHSRGIAGSAKGFRH